MEKEVGAIKKMSKDNLQGLLKMRKRHFTVPAKKGKGSVYKRNNKKIEY